MVDVLAELDEAIAELSGAIAALELALEGDPGAAKLESAAESLALAASALEEAAAAFEALEAPVLPPDLALPAALQPPAPEPLIELPALTGRDQIVLMARDPQSAYTWWELTPAGVGRAQAALDEPGELVLRVYLLQEDDQPLEVRDVLVTDWLGSQTLVLDRPGVRVVTAIGYRAGASFAHVARAATIRLPRQQPGSSPIRFARPNTPTPRNPARLLPAETPAFVADSPALQAFTLGQAFGAAAAAPAPMSDLHRVVGSNHLLEGPR